MTCTCAVMKHSCDVLCINNIGDKEIEPNVELKLSLARASSVCCWAQRQYWEFFRKYRQFVSKSIFVVFQFSLDSHTHMDANADANSKQAKGHVR